MHKYYMLKIKSTPHVFMAHRYSAERYDFSFEKVRNTVEITCHEKGEVKRCTDDNTETVHEGTVSINTYTRPMRCYTETGNSHVTLGFTFFDGDITEIEPSRVAEVLALQDGVTAILPSCIELSAAPQVRDLLYKTVTAHTVGNAMLSSAYALQITALLSQAVQEIGGSSPAGELYVRRAKEYIAANLHRKISTAEIADALGISYGYFSVLFRQNEGQTAVAYINRKKAERVAELVREKNMTLAAAGEQVGITDENYLSRLFKTQMGLTVSEYRVFLAQKMAWQ